jgi:hypothetical protein
MTEYQVTSWRELPSLVTARNGDDVAKVPMAPRFQEAIDEAAMRLGDTSSDDYLAGWQRGPWGPGEGDPATLAAQVASELDATWTPEAVSDFLKSLGTRGDDQS